MTNISGFHTFGGGLNVNSADALSTNISFIIANDGEYIRFYFNPDPTGTDARYPNEYCLVGTYASAFNSDIRFYFNEEVRNKNSYCDPIFEYFIIRATADSSTLSASPSSVVYSTGASDYKEITLTFANTVTSSNAGINYIEITKPAVWGAWQTNMLFVLSDNDSDGTLETNVNVPYDVYTNATLSNRTIGMGGVAVRTNTNTLMLRLGRQITNGIANQQVKVIFSNTTEITTTGTYQFYAKVNGVLYDPHLNQTNFSTCGPQAPTGSPFNVTVIAPPGNPAERQIRA